MQTQQWRIDLLKAANYIEEHGWCQREGKNAQGNVCAVRAMAVVGFDSEALDNFMTFVNRQGFAYIPLWNDAPGRTKEEVIGALRACAQASF